MQVKKIRSSRYRFWRSLVIIAVCLIAGLFLGMVVARYDLANVNWSSLVDRSLIRGATIFVAVLLFLGVVYYLHRSKRAMSRLRETDDEESIGVLDGEANRAFGIAGILVSLLQVPFMFYISTAYSQGVFKGGRDFILVLVQSACLFLLLIMASLLFGRGFKLVNGVEMPKHSSIKENREFLMGMMDEAEKQINYEENFELIMRLVHLVFPTVYLLLFGLSLVFGLDVTLAILAVSIIFIYLILGQYRIIKRYYR